MDKMKWWNRDRFKHVTRPYSHSEVKSLSGSLKIEYTLAKIGSEKLWDILHTKKYVSALGALTGNQAMQQAKAGLDSVYLSGWESLVMRMIVYKCILINHYMQSAVFPQ